MTKLSSRHTLFSRPAENGDVELIRSHLARWEPWAVIVGAFVYASLMHFVTNGDVARALLR